MRILAATDFSTRSNRACTASRACLAQAGGAQLNLVHVVDDDQPAELVEMERREAERVLAEQMKRQCRSSGQFECRPMVVSR